MKTLVILTAILFCFSSLVFGQVAPAESPEASIIQRIGFSDVEINYARPSVKGRKIFGSLVPYGEIWRTGANYPTFFTSKDTLLVEGKPLPPGKYAFYTIPGKAEWIIVFSSNTELWGAYGYTDSADVLRVKVKPRESSFTESFAIGWKDISSNTATLVLTWAEVEVPVSFRADIDHRVIANVRKRLAEVTDSAWIAGIYWQGANYLAASKVMPELAMQWIDSSLAIGEDYFNLWTKAKLLANREDYPAAANAGKRALEAGRAVPQYFPYEEAFTTEIKKWEQYGNKTRK